MDSDLVRLQVDEAVHGLVDETRSADRSHVDACIADVLHVEALDAEREKHCAVGEIFDYHILFALVLCRSAHDIAVVRQVFDQQMIACGNDLVKRCGARSLSTGLGF